MGIRGAAPVFPRREATINLRGGTRTEREVLTRRVPTATGTSQHAIAQPGSFELSSAPHAS